MIFLIELFCVNESGESWLEIIHCGIDFFLSSTGISRMTFAIIRVPVLNLIICCGGGICDCC